MNSAYSDNAQSDSAFLDIAANLLAIILIVTLFSLLTVQRHPHSSSDPEAAPDPPLPFKTPQRSLFPPFSDFYFVLNDRLTRWQQEPVIAALLDNPNALRGVTPQGRYQWLPEPLTPRDIDTYRLNFFIDPKAVAMQEEPLTAAEMDELSANLTAIFEHTRVAPVFIVYPSGMEVFAELYPRLENTQIPFRWFARAENAPLYLGRFPAQFTRTDIYW